MDEFWVFHDVTNPIGIFVLGVCVTVELVAFLMKHIPHTIVLFTPNFVGVVLLDHTAWSPYSKKLYQYFANTFTLMRGFNKTWIRWSCFMYFLAVLGGVVVGSLE
jgi:hypothetical protein